MGRDARLAVRVISEPASLGELAEEWRGLQRADPEATPFLSPEWTASCWAHLRASRVDLHVVACWEGSRLVALAPLCVERRAGLRILRYIGEGRSDYLGVLARSSEARRALLGGLVSLRSWDVGVFSCSRSPTFSCGPGSPRGGGYCRVLTQSSYVAHDGPWASLVAQGPHWLTRMRRKMRKFAAAGGTLERHQGAPAAALVDEVGEVERRSWRAASGKLVFSAPRGAAFLREALTTMGATGEIELWIARIGGRAVGFEVNLLTPKWIGLLFGGHDEAFRSLGPGSVLEFASIERAWCEGVREYDYLGGEESYKDERTTSRRPVYVEIVPGPTRLGDVGLLAVAGVYEAQQWLIRRRQQDRK